MPSGMPRSRAIHAPARVQPAGRYTMITNEERKRFRACHFSAHRRGATLISLPASTLATVSARLVPGVVPHRYRMSNEFTAGGLEHRYRRGRDPGPDVPVHTIRLRWETRMNNIFWIIGVIVVVLAVLSFLGLR